MLEDRSEFYKMSTPISVPLRFCRDGFFRLAADMTCLGCGRRFVQVVRVPRNLRGNIILPERMPDPTDEQMVSKIMLSACEHGVGNPKLHTPECWVGKHKRTGPMVLKGMRPRNRQ